MADHHVDFLERTLVEELVDPLSGGQLSLFVLTSDGTLTAGVERLGAEPPQLLDAILCTQGLLLRSGSVWRHPIR
jgi:hypothetical protein